MQDLARLIEKHTQIDSQRHGTGNMAPEDPLSGLHNDVLPMFEYVVSNYVCNSVLDVGAGYGTDAEWFAKDYKDVTALVLHDAPGLLDRAEKYGFSVVTGDMHNIPLPAATYDLVLCKHVLEHSLLPMVVIEEIKRVLHDDGLLLMVVPPLTEDVLQGHYFPGWSPQQLAYMLAVCGFQILREEQLGWNSCVVARKTGNSYTGELFDEIKDRWTQS